MVRRAVVGDEESLARLNQIVLDVHVAERPDQFKATSVQELTEWFTSFLQNPMVHVWIAEDGGRAVGYVSAVVHERPETTFMPLRRWCELDQIVVDPAWRQRGIARALVLEVIDQARAEGVESVETVSWSFNQQSQQMFQRLGFRPKSVRLELPLV